MARKWIWTFLLLLICSNSFANSNNVPAGFEMLSEPQITAVDVYYGSNYLTTTLVEYTPETVEFLNPDVVLDLIPEIIGRASLTSRLTGPQDRNSELVCITAFNTNCGKLEPDFIGVIFNEGTFRVDLFIHRDLLLTRQIKIDKFLPDPSYEGVSFLQNLSTAYSSSSNRSDNYSINGNTFLAKKKTRLASIWSHSKLNDTDIDTLSFQMDHDQFEYEAGYFRPRPSSLSFARTDDIAGVAFARSLKTRADLEQITGTKLQVYLSQRSQVDLIRDGRLYSSRIYDAGNQELDTSQLPSGSYNVTIRIRDNSGGEEVITRFFVKSSRIPPTGEKIYHIELGKVVRNDPDSALPETLGEWIMRSGYAHRLNKTTGIEVGLAAVDTHALAEFDVQWILPTWDITFESMFSTQGDFGVATQLFKRYKKFSTNISSRKTWARHSQAEVSRYLLVPDDVSQFNFTANYNFLAGQLSYNRNISRLGDSDKIDVRSWQYGQPLVRWKDNSLFFNLDYTDTRDDKIFTASLDWKYFGDHFSTGLKGTYEDINPKDGEREDFFNRRAELGFRDEEIFPEDITAQVFYDNNRDLDEVGASTRIGSTYGILGAEWSDAEQSNGVNRTLTSLRYNTSFGFTSKASGIGGQQGGNASVVFEIQSDTKKAAFDVIVDGVPYAIARSGRSLVLNLRPYHTYNIQLQDRGDVFVASSSRNYKVTLFPGNVVPIIIDAPKVHIAFGRIVIAETICAFTHDDECYSINAPMKNAVIYGSHGYSTTDFSGGFQAELSKKNKHLLVRSRDQSCIASVPSDAETDGDLMYLETITCTPTKARTLLEWYEQNPAEARAAGIDISEYLEAQKLSQTSVYDPRIQKVKAEDELKSDSEVLTN